MGVYLNLNSKIRALEWDLVRSLRVSIDLGIHSEGWSKKQAISYWKEVAPKSLHKIAEREISRIFRWPGQVISYEYGKMRIQQAKSLFQEQGKSLIEFHEAVLGLGQVPTSMLEVFLGLRQDS